VFERAVEGHRVGDGGRVDDRAGGPRVKAISLAAVGGVQQGDDRQ
jgi:hypothetical protein